MIERRIFGEKAVDRECCSYSAPAVVTLEDRGERVTCEVKDKAVLVVHSLDQRIEYRVHED